MNYDMLLVSRFIVGIGVGGEFMIGYRDALRDGRHDSTAVA